MSSYLRLCTLPVTSSGYTVKKTIICLILKGFCRFLPVRNKSEKPISFNNPSLREFHGLCFPLKPLQKGVAAFGGKPEIFFFWNDCGGLLTCR